MTENEEVFSAGHQEHHPAGGADAPDADDLDRGVHHLVMIEQHAMARRQGFAVPVEGLLDFPVEDRRKLVFEVRRPVRVVYELWEVAFGSAALARLRQGLDRAAADPGILNARDQHVGLDGEVPQVQDFHLAELGHMLAVGPDTAEHRIPGDGFAEAVVATGDHNAGRQPLEVPLPGRREGLIEVVEGEDDLPFRGGEAAEVDQMRVSAALHADAGRGSARQIQRHGVGRAPVEGEGRQHHAPVAQGKEIGEAPLVGLQHHADRIRPVVRRLPLGVGRSRTLVA